MDVYEVAETMLAVREYKDQSIPGEVLGRILNAGRLTASSRNSQRWRFVVVRDRALLVQLADLAPGGDYIGQAAMAIAVFLLDNQPASLADGARAIQSMMLVAWGDGIGSNWVGLLKREEIKELLKVPPDYHLLAVLPFGYPARKIGQGKKNRKALAEIAYGERFGNILEF